MIIFSNYTETPMKRAAREAKERILETWNKPLKYKQTNADLVRSMSNDDLAILFTEGCCRDSDCPEEYFMGDGLNCYKCWLDWLDQEIEEGK